MYFRSLVTALPPLGVPSGVSISIMVAARSAPIMGSARLANFARISLGVRLYVGISKKSAWFFISCEAKFEIGAASLQA